MKKLVPLLQGGVRGGPLKKFDSKCRSILKSPSSQEGLGEVHVKKFDPKCRSILKSPSSKEGLGEVDFEIIGITYQ